jgi:hypothetical protein
MLEKAYDMVVNELYLPATDLSVAQHQTRRQQGKARQAWARLQTMGEVVREKE